MILLLVFGLSTLSSIYADKVISPQIRIVDMATEPPVTRLIPYSAEYRSPFRTVFRQQIGRDQSVGPQSHIIRNDYPLEIFKDWKANPSPEFSSPAQNFAEFARRQNAQSAPEFYGQQVPPPQKLVLAYSLVSSNVIKVVDDSPADRFGGNDYGKLYGGSGRRPQPSFEPIRPQKIVTPLLPHSPNLPENFPSVFSPNSEFRFSSAGQTVPQPQQYFYEREGFYSTHTVNFDKEHVSSPDDQVDILPGSLNQEVKSNPFLCGFIKLNQRQFPESGVPCGRSGDDLPVSLPEYPDYSDLPNHKIPVEHRRQHFQRRRMKRSEGKESYGGREKREVGFGYGYSGWGSPFSYDGGYDGYNPGREGYRSFGNNYGSSYYGGGSSSNNNRDRNQGYRNTYYGGGRYDEYDDSPSRGLTGYLTNGGRRYESRRNNNDDEDDENGDENDNNHESESDEEMDRMNSNRRDANGRRGNDDSRERRRNNNNSSSNNNDDDDYKDSRRSSNRNNSRRSNNNNRRNNDRYDYNGNNRNRYYGNYGGYGNGGYGSTYRNNGGGYGYGGSYGGYGNGFGSF